MGTGGALFSGVISDGGDGAFSFLDAERCCWWVRRLKLFTLAFTWPPLKRGSMGQLCGVECRHVPRQHPGGELLATYISLYRGRGRIRGSWEIYMWAHLAGWHVHSSTRYHSLHQFSLFSSLSSEPPPHSPYWPYCSLYSVPSDGLELTLLELGALGVTGETLLFAVGVVCQPTLPRWNPGWIVFRSSLLSSSRL